MSGTIRRKRRRTTPARLGLYAFLIICALFFLAPLYVMLVTSFKGMPEIRHGQHPRPARRSLPSLPG